jgi:hypothetical protein
MTVLIPHEKGFECEDCDFVTDDIFLFLEHCDISFSWAVRLSNRYTLDLFAILEEINQTIQSGHIDCAIDLVQSVTLAMVNASEGEQSFHKFITEAMTMEAAHEMMHGIEEMLNKNGKDNKPE